LSLRQDFDAHTLGKKQNIVDFIYKAHLLIKYGQVGDLTVTRIMDLIGTALDIGTPLVPPHLHVKILSKIPDLCSYNSELHIGKNIIDNSGSQKKSGEVPAGISNCFGRSFRSDSRAQSVSTCPVNWFANNSNMQPNIFVRDTSNQTAMIHQNGRIQIHRLTKKHIGKLNTKDFDLFMNIASEQMFIRHHSGKIITYEGKIPGVGTGSLSLLFTLLTQPSEFLSANKSYQNITSFNTHSRYSSLGIRLALLRKSFGENDKEPWFFLTRAPSSMAFSKESSYCVISGARFKSTN